LKAIKWLDNYFEEAVLVLLLGVICVVMMLQIIMRYIVGSSLGWAEELCRYCFVFSGFMALSFCTKHNTNIRMDSIPLLMPKTLGKAVFLLTDFIMMVFYSYFFFKSFELISVTKATGAFSAALKLPYYILYTSLMMGFGLAAIRMVQKMVKSAIASKSKKNNKRGNVII